MTVFSLTDIPEFSKKQRIVVVGIIGKSPYRYPNKTTPLLPGVQSDEVERHFWLLINKFRKCLLI